MTQPRPRAQRPGPWWAAARAHALTAAVLSGLPVFPLTRHKLPAIPSAHPDTDTPCAGECGALGHGVHDATADPQRVKALFTAAPWAAGYGIACGHAPHHLFGLDLDRKNGVDGPAALHDLAAAHGFLMPRTTTVVTPSGGLHLWLTAPAGTRIPNTASALGPGIDTRGTGGYLVGPGSLGTTGRYHYAPGTAAAAPIAPAPPPLLALLTAPATSRGPALQAARTAPSGSFERRLDGLVRVVLDCGPGDLNNRLYWASRRAFEAADIDPESATERLLAAAVDRGHPEIPARRTIASARKATTRPKEETS